MWYDKDTYDVFEVIPNGDILYDEINHKYCSSEITIIRQLSDEEINEIMDRECDILVHDSERGICYGVAKHVKGKDLDILVRILDWNVRLEDTKRTIDKEPVCISHLLVPIQII